MKADRPPVLVTRHGETTWNREGRMQGGTDTELSALGLAQAQVLAARLAREGLARVVTSDLARARVTAEAVATACGVPLELDPRLRELRMGAWEGLTWREAEARDPEVVRAFHAMVPGTRPPGGETREELGARVWEAFEAHAATSAEGPVLLVTHGAALQMLIRRVVGIAPSSERRFLVPNVGLSTFVHARGHWYARTLSDTTHLASAGLDSFPNE